MISKLNFNQGMSSGKYSKLKLVWYPEKLKSFINEKPTAPIYVRVKPTNVCNHNCFFCIYATSFSGIHEEMKERDTIPFDKMMEILEDFKEMGVKAITLSGGGEPLVYKHIIPTIESILEKDIKLSMITNGQLLMGEKAKLMANANWVRVSVDYFNEYQFNKSRRIPGRLYSKVFENMENFAKIKKPHCSLQVNYIVHKYNKDHLFESAKMLKKLGVENLRFSPMWNQNFEEYHKPFKEHASKQITRAKKELSDDKFEVGSSYDYYFEGAGRKERPYTKCYFMQVVPVIGADCKVYYCHNKAYDATGCYGSIKNQRFKDLWFSEQAAKQMKTFNPQKICKHELGIRYS